MRAPVLLSLLASAGCTGSLESEAAGADAGPGAPPAIVLHRVTFVHSRGSEITARGEMDALTYVRETGDAVAAQVAVRFPKDAQGDRFVDLTSPRALGNPMDEEVLGQGGVQFTNQAGDHGETEEAAYDGRLGLAHGETPVQLFWPGFVERSAGFRWRAADDRLDLGPATVVTRGAIEPARAARARRGARPGRGPVRRGRPRTRRRVRITCDDMVVQNRVQIARCEGHVKATRLTMLLTCDRSLAHYDQEGHIVDLTCFDHVKVIDGDRVATGDKGVYVEEQRTVELTGHAVVKQKEDVLQGEPIVLYVDEDRVVAKGARLLGTAADLPGKSDAGAAAPKASPR